MDHDKGVVIINQELEISSTSNVTVLKLGGFIFSPEKLRSLANQIEQNLEKAKNEVS
jgi:hypothetical protein